MWVTSVSLSANGDWVFSGGRDGTVRVWEAASGRCLYTFQDRSSPVIVISLSANGRWLVASYEDGTLLRRELDWELAAHDLADWDEGASSYLESFLVLHTPYATELPAERKVSAQEVQQALTHRGTPTWSEEDFQCLLRQLLNFGYGWLRPEGVRRQLEQMVHNWQGLPPLPGE
jgi:hypothetical protein